jgi:hypothetical protein
MVGSTCFELFIAYDLFSHDSQTHSSQYPVLARMARDYLAIQGSAVSSERAFSSGGITATPRRNCLSPKAFGQLQLLKSAYRNGHISASLEGLVSEPSDEAPPEDVVFA